jgi:hypothetical protein
VRYTHRGEEQYQESKEWIRGLLEEAGSDLSQIDLDDSPDPSFDRQAYVSDLDLRITREIYGGWRRNAVPGGIYIAHASYYEGAEQVRDYVDPGGHQNQFLYLSGLWENGLESIRHARVTMGLEDYMALRFAASSVNAVFDPEGETFEVEITMDGRPLTQDEAGEDLIVEDGRSYLLVDSPRLFAIVELGSFEAHELKLASNSDRFALYAFTFGAYDEGP